MEMLIKTENAAQFIAENFISPDIRRGGFDAIHLVDFETKNEVLISKKSGLNSGDSLIINSHFEHNKRCTVSEQFTYKLSEHDSVSLKGSLVSYRPLATIK